MPTYTNDTGTTQIVTNLAGNNVVVVPGESIQTYLILGTGWTKTDDEPWYPLATKHVTVTAPGTATELIDQKIIRVMALVDGITMAANDADNPYAYPLTKNVAVDVENGGEIDILAFGGTGDVLVIGLPA